jgi:hypothetical protein
LYLSQTGLSGALPDVVPRNSSLKALFAIGLFDNQRRDPTNFGFRGAHHVLLEVQRSNHSNNSPASHTVPE